MTGLDQNGLPNVRLPRFRGRRPRLFGRRRLLATSAGVKSLPNVKELTSGHSHTLVHGFRANILWGYAYGTWSSSRRRDTLTSFDSDSCCAGSSCCRAGPPALLLATLGGVSKQILIIFFMSTHRDQWFCAKRYLILGS